MRKNFTLNILTAAIAFLLPLTLSAQQKSVTGVVRSSEGELLTGTTVTVEGTNLWAITDLQGRYTINMTSADAVLSFSMLGYQELKIALPASQIHLDAELKSEATRMDDVVVIGYGTVRRSTLTNSVATVSSDEFVEGAVNSPLQLLQGKVAGLAVSTSSGNPNSDNVQLMLRGVSTLMSDQEPLIIIDGISGGSLSNVTSDDVLSVDVLKDGSAAAIYGTRGTNGVILITTKRGTTSKTSVTYHGYVSVESISNQIEVFSPEEYRNLATTTGGAFTPLDQGSDTNWGNLVLRSGINQYHNVSISNGTAESNYYANITYRQRQGIIRNTGLDKFNISTGFNQSLFDGRMTVSGNISNIMANGTNVSNAQAYLGTLTTNPTYPIYNDATGEYSIFAAVANPVKLINEFREDVNWDELSANGKITLNLTDDFVLNAVGNVKNFYHFNGSYATKYFDENNLNGQAWRNTSNNKTYTFETFGQYSKRFGKHDIVALAGYSYIAYDGQSLNTYNYDFPTDMFEYNNMGLGLALKDGQATISTGHSMNKLISFFGRINYGYADKYLFSATIREDGSSKFGPNNRWGTFYSASAAWRITQEDFMRNVRWLNELKVKVSYGVTGVEPASAYLSQQTYNFSDPVYMDGKWIYTASPSRMSNPDLKWEEKRELNAGLDFDMFNHRLSGSLDFYRRATHDLIYTYNVPMPPNVAPTVYANVGSMANTGVELSLTGKVVKTKDFSLTVSGNVSYNDNRIVSLSNDLYERDYLELGSTGSPVQKTTHLVQEGGRVGDFYGWKSTGLKSNGAWIVDGGAYGNDNSRQIIGNGIPKIFAGLSLNMSWRNWDLTTTLRGAFLYQVLNQYRMLWETFQKGQQYNYPKTILDKPYGGDYYLATTSPAYVSWFVEDADFVKVDNLTVGYNFKLDNKYVKNCRLYVAALNLYTFTGYKGIDPEVNFNGLTPGIDYTSTYPTTRTISFGVKLGF